MALRVGQLRLVLPAVLVLAGCAIRTSAHRELTASPPLPQVPPPVVLPGTGSSAVELVSSAVQATPVAPAGRRAAGALEFSGPGRGRCVWQHRPAQQGSLFWHTEGTAIEFLYAWQPDMPKILASKLHRGMRIASVESDPVLGAYLHQLDMGQADVGDVTWFGVRATLFPSRADGRGRGVLFHLSGIGGPTDKELAAIADLQSHGWWVLSERFPEVLSPPRIRRLLGAVRSPPRDVIRPDGDDEPEPEPPPRGEPGGEVVVLSDEAYGCFESSMAACVLDLFLATTVMGFDEIAGDVLAALSDRCGARRALVGVSYGAIAAPAVLASMAAPVDSAVLVGGGADLYTAAEQLGLLAWIRDQMLAGWAPRTGRRDRRLGEAVYLETCDLEPFHWAPAAAGMRLLQVHAMFDAIVSARCGRVLYQRLDHPERWEYPYGHILLMTLLPAADVIRWIESGPGEP